MSIQCYKIQIIGKVQGVYYRESTKSKALELGISGNVRNETDGSVVVIAEGNQSQLSELLSWCKIGPPAAKVEEVIVLEILPIQHLESFSVLK